MFVAVDEPGNGVPVAAFGDITDGEVVVLAGDEIDRVGLFKFGARIDGNVGADQTDLDAGLG